jgi:hypothetical protein
MTKTIQATLFTLLVLSIAVPTTGMAFAVGQNATDAVAMKDSVEVTKSSSVMSLKAQLEKTTSVEELSCPQSNQVLILKQSDNTPACVKFSSQEKLLDRGWGIFI